MTDALPLLYQSGYLTIKKFEPMFQEYTLGIPNKEVRDGLLNSLIPHYVNPRRSDNNAFLLGFCKAVYRNDIEAALEHMRTYMATIPYDLENHSEKHYQTIFYLMFSFLNIYIRTEVKSAIGRADAVMYMPDTIYVFELKVDKSAEEALAQIDEKGYMLPYHSEGKRLVKIGISFEDVYRIWHVHYSISPADGALHFRTDIDVEETEHQIEDSLIMLLAVILQIDEKIGRAHV